MSDTMSWLTKCVFVSIVCVGVYSSSAFGDTEQSIVEIQSNVLGDGSGTSTYNGQTLPCAGGIVIDISTARNFDRIQIYDQAGQSGWGAIQVVDITTSENAFADISKGDWVKFTGIYVSDTTSDKQSRGTTVLEYLDTTTHEKDPNKSINPDSLPAGLVVNCSAIAAPDYNGSDPQSPTNPDDWDKILDDHSAEPYESMLLTIENVTVVAKGLGAKQDIYCLQTADGDNVWASDYINTNAVEDATGASYDPHVVVGTHFTSVTGMLEQYNNGEYDYYQFLTRSSADFVPEPASVLLLALGAAWLVSRRKA